MVKNLKLILILLGVTIFFSSCLKEERELKIIEQEAAIDSYIDKNFADSTIINNGGVNRIIIGQPTGSETLQFGDSLYFYYSGCVFNNGSFSLFATNNEYVAEDSKMELSDPDFSVKKILFEEGKLIEGLELGLSGIGQGEHSIIVFSPRYGFNAKEVYNIPELSSLLFEVWIVKIKKK